MSLSTAAITYADTVHALLTLCPVLTAGRPAIWLIGADLIEALTQRP
jgi:hypothetical protein